MNKFCIDYIKLRDLPKRDVQTSSAKAFNCTKSSLKDAIASCVQYHKKPHTEVFN